MDEESNRLAGLLNISTPANPGKPAPWTPPQEGYHPEPVAAPTEPGGSAAQAHGPREPQGPRAPEPRAPEPRAPDRPWGPPAVAAEEPGGPADQPAPSAPDDDGRVELPPWDPAAVSEIFGRTVAAAQAQQTQLEQAMAAAKERTYVAESADGEVRVTVDGRPRVTEVYVSARAVRNGPGPLGAAITEATNAAVRVARQGANEAVLDGLDPATRAAIEEGLAETAGPADQTRRGL
jgi:DNA-binding protein YbaB